MCYILVNRRVHRLCVWLGLSILTWGWIPVVSVAQQSPATEAAPEVSGPGTVLWTFDVGSIYPSKHMGPRAVVIVGERLYFGGADGNFYALDKHTGQEQWRVKLPGFV